MDAAERMAILPITYSSLTASMLKNDVIIAL
jgi:hypothetical protein